MINAIINQYFNQVDLYCSNAGKLRFNLDSNTPVMLEAMCFWVDGAGLREVSHGFKTPHELK